MTPEEVELNKTFLSDSEEKMAAAKERHANLKARLSDLKRKVSEQMDRGLFEQAILSVQQAAALARDCEATSEEVKIQEGRCANIRRAIEAATRESAKPAK